MKLKLLRKGQRLKATDWMNCVDNQKKYSHLPNWLDTKGMGWLPLSLVWVGLTIEGRGKIAAASHLLFART